MIHMYIEIDVDADKYLYHKLIVYICMLRCKPMILIILILAKTCLKVFKFNCCRLMNHLPLEAFACLEV
jgi:hypothetical protein